MAREAYAAQVALLVRALPLVADEPHFALKGGTAINLFYRDMPRLSVDIDLTYLPLDDRTTALANISDAFGRLVDRAPRDLHGVEAQRISGGGDGDSREASATEASLAGAIRPTIGRCHFLIERRVRGACGQSAVASRELRQGPVRRPPMPLLPRRACLIARAACRRARPRQGSA